jgi:hypothetical protein
MCVGCVQIRLKLSYGQLTLHHHRRDRNVILFGIASQQIKIGVTISPGKSVACLQSCTCMF